MKGMGADAFFNPPSVIDKSEKTQPSQTEASPLAFNERYKGKAPDVIIKCTFYIRVKDDMKLEQIRLDRLMKGKKYDKSDLVKKAISLLK